MKLNKQGVRDMNEPGNGAAVPRVKSVQVVRRYAGGLEEVNRILCTMSGHAWKCFREEITQEYPNGKDVCARCGTEDGCEHRFATQGRDWSDVD